jgi:hypothetical protein
LAALSAVLVAVERVTDALDAARRRVMDLAQALALQRRAGRARDGVVGAAEQIERLDRRSTHGRRHAIRVVARVEPLAI